MAEFLAALAKQGKPGEFAYVDKLKAYIYLKVGRPSPCLRAPAGCDWPRDMPCLQMQATDPEGDVGKAVRACTIEHYELLAIEVRAQAPPCRAGQTCW